LHRCIHGKELLRQPKVGARTVARIEEWLASRERRLRRSDEDIVAVISGFKVKRLVTWQPDAKPVRAQ
jgi:hypothetical protein